MYACESGDAISVKLLLENGASLECVVSGDLYYFLKIRITMIRINNYYQSLIDLPFVNNCTVEPPVSDHP